MANTKHTAGPWYADRALAIWGTVNGEQELIAKAAHMPCIDGSGDVAAERGMDMEMANARLIAAAPELLSALEACATALEINGLTKLRSNAYQNALAIIAKATA